MLSKAIRTTNGLRTERVSKKADRIAPHFGVKNVKKAIEEDREKIIYLEVTQNSIMKQLSDLQFAVSYNNTAYRPKAIMRNEAGVYLSENTFLKLTEILETPAKATTKLKEMMAKSTFIER